MEERGRKRNTETQNVRSRVPEATAFFPPLLSLSLSFIYESSLCHFVAELFGKFTRRPFGSTLWRRLGDVWARECCRSCTECRDTVRYTERKHLARREIRTRRTAVLINCTYSSALRSFTPSANTRGREHTRNFAKELYCMYRNARTRDTLPVRLQEVRVLLIPFPLCIHPDMCCM